MSVAVSRLIGRDAEIDALVAQVGSREPALVVVAGRPRSGKSSLLREVRARVRDSAVLVPADPDEWLMIDGRMTVDRFRRSTRPSDARSMDLDGRLQVILVQGYRPADDFHEWFVGEFVPRLGTNRPPTVVVVADDRGDVGALEPYAAQTVVLGPLPRPAVVGALRALNATLADPMLPAELDIYADAVVDMPAALEGLRTVLPLTHAPRTTQDR